MEQPPISAGATDVTIDFYIQATQVTGAQLQPLVHAWIALGADLARQQDDGYNSLQSLDGAIPPEGETLYHVAMTVDRVVKPEPAEVSPPAAPPAPPVR
jgi:hypothetical protein